MHDVRPPSPEVNPPAGSSPYLEWALATRFSYLRDGAWLPVLIEFDPLAARASSNEEKLSALEAFATRRWLSDEPRSLDDTFVIPELFARPPPPLRGKRDFPFCVALIRRDVDVVRQLTSMGRWRRTVRRLELGPPIDFPRKGAPPPTPLAPADGRAPPPSALSARDRSGFLAPVIAVAQRGVATVRSWFGGSPGTRASPPPAPGRPGKPGSPGGPRSPGLGQPPQVTPPDAPSASPPAPPTGDGGGGTSSALIERVVVAVIDQGLAFANSRFISNGQPCIDFLWQQNVLGTTVPAPSLTMTFTPGFELDKAAIKQALADAKSAGGDEDWIYRKIGGLDFGVEGYKPLARRRTHGTHVMDLAAGGLNMADHPVIAVDLPEDAVGDPAGSTLAVQAAWGLIYAMDRAERLRRPNEVLPVVANISYGPHEGPHDGSAVFESFMDKMIEVADASDTPLEIVLAAGNFKQTRVHAQFDVAAGTQKALKWRLQPASLSPCLMEIWLPHGGGQPVTVTLTPPAPSAVLRPMQVSPGQLSDGVAVAGNTVYWATYVAATVASGMDSIVLGIARTAPDPAAGWGAAVAPSGVWQVDVTCNAAVAGVKAWIKRSDTPSGRRAKGRQSYFDDPLYPRFHKNGRRHDFDPTTASYVRRFSTLSGIATGDKTRVIGGYIGSLMYPALYSSHGTRKISGSPTGPDWQEISDDSEVLRGALAAGTRSGSVIAMNGTSVAAPQATRWLAQAWRGMTKGSRPPKLRPGLSPPKIPPERPIPPADLAAIGSRFATRTPVWPPRR